MSTSITCANFINGEFAAQAGTSTSDIIDPTTEQVYGSAPLSNASDVDHAVAAASAAFRFWKRTTPAHRQQCLLDFSDALKKHEDELLSAECRNTGKPHEITREAEFGQLYDQIRFIAGAARCLEGRATGEYLPNHTSSIRREPVGVCAQITPWNYPLLMAMWKCIPAIAAGNTTVLKPAELTPVTTQRFCEIASEHLPPGVLNLVCGGAETGQSLVRHPDAAMVSLTGSVRAGTEVAATAGQSIKRTHLELGGKAPVVVFADADLPRAAADIAEAGFFNAGQDCAAATRVLVHQSVHDEFVDALTAASRDIRTGPPTDPDATCGPLISRPQRDRVLRCLEQLPTHAEIVTGGTVPEASGFFLSPTVVTQLRHDDPINGHEIFGPVITVETFADEAEAVSAANAVDYGLTSSIWTQNHARALRMSVELDFGCVWINTHLPLPAEMPHGGFNKSGHGKDMSIYAVEDYTRIKHVMSRHI